MRNRSCKLRLTITMDNEARVYKVRPVRPLHPNLAQALTLHNGDKEYEVNVSLDGYVGCSCMGFHSSKHCKHVDSLMALGILNPEPFMQATKLHLELAGEYLKMEEERKKLREEIDRIRTAQRFEAGKILMSCYGVVPEQQILEPEKPKVKRPRKPRSRKPKDGEQAA